MQAGGGKAEEDVAGCDVRTWKQSTTLDSADRESCDVVIPCDPPRRRIKTKCILASTGRWKEKSNVKHIN